MRLSYIIFSLAAVLTSFGKINAQEENKFQIKPTGRVLIDGAFYSANQSHLFKNGMAIPEARLGAKTSYGNWSSWIDVGIAYGKIGLRNMWIQYDFNKNHMVRIGNFLQPYGYESPTTSNFKSTFEQPLASAIYTPGLHLGAMYTFTNPMFYAAGSFIVESAALTNVMNYPLFNQQGFGLLTRLVWRQKNSGEKYKPILQAGISGGYSTPQQRLVDNEDVHDGFVVAANYPTKVTTLQAIGSTVANSKNLFKFTPEILLAYRKIALESQYFFQQINREAGLHSYVSQSAYATVRAILFGDDYTYDSSIAHLGNPKKNTLELVADYNYAKLSDPKASIFGGRANSFNLTLNYYFNPYITARLNYSYTHAWDRQGYEPVTVNVIQARIMLLF